MTDESLVQRPFTNSEECDYGSRLLIHRTTLVTSPQGLHFSVRKAGSSGPHSPPPFPISYNSRLGRTQGKNEPGPGHACGCMSLISVAANRGRPSGYNPSSPPVRAAKGFVCSD